MNVGCWLADNPLPKGDSRIARQFTAGFSFAIPTVPKGRLNPAYIMRLSLFPSVWQRLGRPFGTRYSYSAIPRLKAWAILESPFGRWQPKSLWSSMFLADRALPAACYSWQAQPRMRPPLVACEANGPVANAWVGVLQRAAVGLLDRHEQGEVVEPAGLVQ